MWIAPLLDSLEFSQNIRVEREREPVPEISLGGTAPMLAYPNLKFKIRLWHSCQRARVPTRIRANGHACQRALVPTGTRENGHSCQRALVKMATYIDAVKNARDSGSISNRSK